MHKEEEKFVPSLVFEGMTSIRAVIKAIDAGESDRKIIKIIYDAEKEKNKCKELNYLKKVAPVYGFEVEKSNADAISELTTGNSHGGIIAVCTSRNTPQLSASLEKINPRGIYVMLDGIEDPYNFGYALRSIYASGADGIILSERNWMTAAGLVARASAGASELCQIFVSDADLAVDIFKEKGYKIICADKENSVSLYDCNLSSPVFLIVGGERRGISASILKKADGIIRIDYGRDFPAALSAASAATILAYEIFRQNKMN